MWSDLSNKELTVGKPALETAFKGTVLPDFLGFFIIYDIKSVLSARALMVFKFFHLVVMLIF